MGERPGSVAAAEAQGVARLPAAVKAYALGVPMLAGLCLFAWGTAWPGGWSGWPGTLAGDWALPLVFAVLTATALLFPLRLSPSYVLTVDVAADFAALLLFGPPVAMLTAGIGNAVGNLILWARGQRDGWNVAFNTGQSMLGLGLAGVACYGVYGIYSGAAPSAPLAVANPVAFATVLLAGATISVFNSLAVAVAVGLQHRQNPLPIWYANWWVQLLPTTALLLVALLTALLVQQHPWAIGVLAVLMAIAYLSLRRMLDLLTREQAARAAAEAAGERVRRLQVVTDAALTHLTLDDLLGVLLVRIHELLAADAGALLLLEPEGNALVAYAAQGLEDAIPPGFRFPIDRERTAWPWVEAQEQHFGDVRGADPADLPPWVCRLRAQGIRSVLRAPLVVEQRVLGELCVGALQPRRFGEDDRHLLQLFADRVATAVDHARLYEAERQARAEAERAVQVRGEFLSVASHELKTPVTSLRGYAQLLLRQFDRKDGPDPAQLRRALEVIDRQTDKLNRLTMQLLDISRIQAGTLVIDRRMTDVTALVEETVAIARTTSGRDLVIHAPTPVQAWIDPLRVEQVLTNLVDNAIKY
ncbi:MAG: sensor histidine kinase, partial [Chloroflexota bacterium]